MSQKLPDEGNESVRPKSGHLEDNSMKLESVPPTPRGNNKSSVDQSGEGPVVQTTQVQLKQSQFEADILKPKNKESSKEESEPKQPIVVEEGKKEGQGEAVGKKLETSEQIGEKGQGSLVGGAGSEKEVEKAGEDKKAHQHQEKGGASDQKPPPGIQANAKLVKDGVNELTNPARVGQGEGGDQVDVEPETVSQPKLETGANEIIAQSQKEKSGGAEQELSKREDEKPEDDEEKHENSRKDEQGVGGAPEVKIGSINNAEPNIDAQGLNQPSTERADQGLLTEGKHTYSHIMASSGGRDSSPNPLQGQSREEVPNQDEERQEERPQEQPGPPNPQEQSHIPNAQNDEKPETQRPAVLQEDQKVDKIVHEPPAQVPEPQNNPGEAEPSEKPQNKQEKEVSVPRQQDPVQEALDLAKDHEVFNTSHFAERTVESKALDQSQPNPGKSSHLKLQKQLRAQQEHYHSNPPKTTKAKKKSKRRLLSKTQKGRKREKMAKKRGDVLVEFYGPPPPSEYEIPAYLLPKKFGRKQKEQEAARKAKSKPKLKKKKKRKKLKIKAKTNIDQPSGAQNDEKGGGDDAEKPRNRRKNLGFPKIDTTQKSFKIKSTRANSAKPNKKSASMATITSNYPEAIRFYSKNLEKNFNFSARPNDSNLNEELSEYSKKWSSIDLRDKMLSSLQEFQKNQKIPKNLKQLKKLPKSQSTRQARPKAIIASKKVNIYTSKQHLALHLQEYTNHDLNKLKEAVDRQNHIHTSKNFHNNLRLTLQELGDLQKVKRRKVTSPEKQLLYCTLKTLIREKDQSDGGKDPIFDAGFVPEFRKIGPIPKKCTRPIFLVRRPMSTFYNPMRKEMINGTTRNMRQNEMRTRRHFSQSLGYLKPEKAKNLNQKPYKLPSNFVGLKKRREVIEKLDELGEQDIGPYGVLDSPKFDAYVEKRNVPILRKFEVDPPADIEKKLALKLY